MNEKKTWIVAVSGGPDSMALLDLLYNNKYKLVVAHVNYLTRDTSLRDENIVKSYCKTHNIIFRMKKFNVDDVGNFQHDARNFRYEFFKELVAEYKAAGVAMGHHFNDDLETYVFQKNRSMHSDNIGIASKTTIKGINVWRPLLGYTKTRILEYCQDNKIEYGIDESNLELDYTRNKIRNKISQMSQFEYDNLLIEMKTNRASWENFKKDMLESVNSWETLVPLDTYAKVVESNRFLYLREWLIQNDIDVHEMSEEYLMEIDRNIIKKKANYQFQDTVLISSYGDISIFKIENYEFILETLVLFESKYFSLKTNGLKRQGITVSENDFPLTIRNARAGDKIKMRYGSKKVNRYFIDEKIPHYKRVKWPVIENAKKEIIFVAGIGCSMHHYSNNPTFYMIEYKVS